jgi:hypothetical protein
MPQFYDSCARPISGLYLPQLLGTCCAGRVSGLLNN